jgi:superfamily II RNA helicase
MTTDELEKLLAEQPVGCLHRLAHGRIPRHFRYGKQRLIEALLRASVENRAGLVSDLQILVQEGEKLRSKLQKRQGAEGTTPQTGHARRPGRTGAAIARAGGPQETEPHEPAPDLAAFLEGIGVPPPLPFVPDAWQIEALTHLESTDVIVSVPTGSGKTYVAIEAARRAIEADRSVIYTSPLKALSNTKFTELTKLFGSDRVGILTGDRKDNPQAPLLIMTTEILRNLLYDAAGGEIDVRLDTLGLVIMDESQYIADPERGVVWEETIIFCPTQARLLLLSASIGNPHDVAAWLTSIRPTPCHLIRHHQRSVPLRAGYLHPNGKLTPLFRSIGIPHKGMASLHPEAKRLFAQYEEETLRPR